MSALCGAGWATVTRDKFGPRAWRKVCPRREERAAELRGGVACRLRGAAWTRSPGASAPSGVGRWRLLRTLPSPRPLPLPHHTPTPRRRHATGRSLSWAIAAQPLSSGRPARLGAAKPSGCLKHPTGVAGSCSDCAAASTGLN